MNNAIQLILNLNSVISVAGPGGLFGQRAQFSPKICMKMKNFWSKMWIRSCLDPQIILNYSYSFLVDVKWELDTVLNVTVLRLYLE